MPVTLGIARGRIEIDTSDIAAARVVIEREARIMGKSFDEAGKKGEAGAKKTVDAWSKASSGLRVIANDFAAISLAGAGMVAIGVKGADSLRLYRAQYKALLGDQTKADQVMQKLVKSANQFGLEQNEMLQLGRSLLPILKGSTEQLDAWVKRAVLLASTNPMKSTSEGIRAISEFMAGQDMSLIRIFNVPPELVQQAKAATKDVGEQLDMILKSLGASEEAAKELGNTLGGALNRGMNAAQTFLGTALRPIIDNFFVPALNLASRFLTELNQFSPALTSLAGGFVTVAAAITPVSFALGKVIDGLRLVKKFGGTGVGKVAVGVGAVAAGAELGVGLVHKLGEGYGRDDLKNYQLGDALRTIIQMVGTAFIGLVTIVLKVSEALAGFAFEVTKIPERIKNALPPVLGGTGRGWKTDDDIRREDYLKRTYGPPNPADLVSEKDKFMAPVYQRGADILEGIAKFVGALGSGAPGAPGGEGGTGGAGAAPTTTPLGFSEEQLQAWEEHKKRNAEIDAEANEQLEEEEARHGERLLEIKQKSDKALEKFDADEKKRHERAVADLERNIQDVRDNAKDREVQAAQEIEKAKADAQVEELRAVKEHQREMLDMQREHRETLLEAAARLDARAVFEEMRNYSRRQDRAEEQYDEQRTKERDALQEHIQSIQERVDADNAADEARIEKMRADFAIEEGIRQEDARERRAELVQQGRDELAQENKNHADRLAQIDRNHAKELKKENDRFIDEFNALAGHNGRMLNLYKTGLGDLERELNNWFHRQQGQIAAVAGQPITTAGPVATAPATNPNVPTVTSLPSTGHIGTGYASPTPWNDPRHYLGGGRAAGTNWANAGDWAHPGEVIANRDVSDLIRSVIGPDFTQPELAAAFMGGGRGDINISVPVTAQRGMSPREIGAMVGQIVEDKLIEEFDAE